VYTSVETTAGLACGPSVSADKDFCVQLLGERDFSIPGNAQSGSEAQPASYLIGTAVLSQRLRAEGDNSTASSIEFKMCSYPLTPPPAYSFMVRTGTFFFIRVYLRVKYASMCSHETLSAKLHGVTSQKIVFLHSGYLVSRPRCEPATVVDYDACSVEVGLILRCHGTLSLDLGLRGTR
jgi:hypothetical protein